MASAAGASNHMRHYVCLGLRVAVASSVHRRFTMTQPARGMNGNGATSHGMNRTQPEPARSADLWIMVIIPIYEAVQFADAVLQNLFEFWNGEVIEIGTVDERGGAAVAPQPAINGSRSVMTVVHDKSLVTEQHVVKVNENGFEMDDGIRLALQPLADGREAVVTISRENELLIEQRVVKVKANSFEVRDPSGKLTGTIHKTTAGGIPLTDDRGRVVRRLTAEQLVDLFRNSGLGGPSIQSSVSYGLTPVGSDVA